MRKLNNKGFMLVETLIVAVFLVTIFSILYTNFYPLIGEYERREFYDDIDSKYSIYWIKRIVQSGTYNLNKAEISSNTFTKFSCNNIVGDNDQKATCQETITRTGADINNIYIIDYVTTNFKNKVNSNKSAYDEDFRDYLDYLPEFTKGSLNGALYRLIVIFHNTKDNNDFYSYATIEVKK